MLLICALLLTSTLGCDRVKPVLDSAKQKFEVLRQRITRKKPVAARPVTPEPAAPVAPEPPAAPTAPAPPPPTQQVVMNPPRPRKDVPYVSNDTGTVFPGMSERDVYSMWGSPAAVRHYGEYTYLFFQNGCEYSCGTLDVVTLQRGQVVDAIVRWPGHGYAGEDEKEGAIESNPSENEMAPTPAPAPTPDTTSAAPPQPQE
jgi:hypothetical protein